MSEFANTLRFIADALDDDKLTADSLLLVGRLSDGRIISEDSGLTVIEAAQMARDFVYELRDMRDTWKARNRRQLVGCTRCRQRRTRS